MSITFFFLFFFVPISKNLAEATKKVYKGNMEEEEKEEEAAVVDRMYEKRRVYV